MSVCRSCGAEITFARIIKHGQEKNLMPFDAEPVPDGEWLLVGERATYVGKDPSLISDGRHRTHFATCPHADQHRKKAA